EDRRDLGGLERRLAVGHAGLDLPPQALDHQAAPAAAGRDHRAAEGALEGPGARVQAQPVLLLLHTMALHAPRGEDRLHRRVLGGRARRLFAGVRGHGGGQERGAGPEGGGSRGHGVLPPSIASPVEPGPGRSFRDPVRSPLAPKQENEPSVPLLRMEGVMRNRRIPRLTLGLSALLALGSAGVTFADNPSVPFIVSLRGNANPTPTADPCILLNTE